MLKTIARSIVWTVILIMAFECISSAVVMPAERSFKKVTIHQKDSKTSLVSAILSARAEEENEKNEEERDKIWAVELADFSKIATALSIFHSPEAHFSYYKHSIKAQPRKLFAFFCVLLI
jgi:hypothetical protein